MKIARTLFGKSHNYKYSPCLGWHFESGQTELRNCLAYSKRHQIRGCLSVYAFRMFELIFTAWIGKEGTAIDFKHLDILYTHTHTQTGNSVLDSRRYINHNSTVFLHKYAANLPKISVCAIQLVTTWTGTSTEFCFDFSFEFKLLSTHDKNASIRLYFLYIYL